MLQQGILVLAVCLIAQSAYVQCDDSPPTPHIPHYFTHMKKFISAQSPTEFHRQLHERAAKAQADAEAVAASGSGTSEYLTWRMQQLQNDNFDSHPDSNSDSNPDSNSGSNADSNLASNSDSDLSSEVGVGYTKGRRLEVLTGSSGASSLQPPPLNSAPGPADMNVSAIRHSSVDISGYPVVDWRTSPALSTPIFDQKGCESCWLSVATDIITMKWSLLSHFLTPIPLSPQHVCDCGFKKCCSGGWPEWTFLFAQLNKGIAPISSYPYLAKDSQKCQSVSSSLLTGKITGWEKLPALNPTALMKTVSMHPVMVLLYAAPTFLKYSGGIYFGTDCPKSSTVNHAVVVMGFNTNSTTPYWIAKNSWGTGWGEGGYVRISMSPTVCGFGSEKSMYPTMFHVFTPCDEVPSPCGAGSCYLLPDGQTARCKCPPGFVEKLEDSAPKCVSATPCQTGINPCSFGTCNNEFDGSYTCWCPPGTIVGSTADGAETCIVNSFQSGLLTSTSIPGDNCTSFVLTYNITVTQLLNMNPFLNCSLPITPGTVLVVAGSSASVSCSATDAIAPGDTCATITERNNLTTSQLLALNPGLKCNALLTSQHICVTVGQLAASSQYERTCGMSYSTEAGDTCFSLVSDYQVSLAVLEWLNPGLDCTQTLPQTSVCVSPLLLGWAGIECSETYKVTQADTCYTVAANAGLDLEDFLRLNPGLRCYWPHWVVGLEVCINGTAMPLSDVTLEPNLIPYYIQTNDTLASISNAYAGVCSVDDGSAIDAATLTTNICWANGWYPGDCSDRRVTLGSMILIPCVKNIGATACSGAYSKTDASTLWISPYVCGSDGVTYISQYCMNIAGAGILLYSGCPACSSYCTGKAGATILSAWGTTTAGCQANEVCTYPQAPTVTTSSQKCTYSTNVSQAVCQWSRYTCSTATSGLSATSPTAQGCVNFKKCLQYSMGYNQYNPNTSCPFQSSLTCGSITSYSMSVCNI